MRIHTCNALTKSEDIRPHPAIPQRVGGVMAPSGGLCLDLITIGLTTPALLICNDDTVPYK